MRFDCSLHGSLLFSHRVVLEAKRTAKISGSRFFQSDCTVQFGFQNLDLNSTVVDEDGWLRSFVPIYKTSN